MKLPLRRNIFFTGFMASGKSRIGALTAASLGWKFFDTDKWVEENTGKTVAELFAERGEAEFRRLEVEALHAVGAENQTVISLGGGTLTNPAALEWIRGHGVLVQLSASPEVILERVNRKKDSRPLLAGMDDAHKLDKIRTLLAQRQPSYDQAELHFESEESVPHHVLMRRIIHRLQVEELEPLWVELGERRYPIYIEDDLSDHVSAIAEKSGCTPPFALVSDHQVKTALAPALEHMRSDLGGCAAFYWKAGEPEKTLASIQKLITWLLRHGFSRRTTLLACGGGVVGDMAGFAAAVFLRGVEFVQIPTTLLAMVDSSVGGKTGVNHPLGKNLIGAFHQPRAVIISLAHLATLPSEDYLAGVAEVAKYAVIRDAEFFAFLETNAEAVLRRDTEALKHCIRTSCAIKAAVVGRDEREASGERALLNYGHTFGHAFETLTDFTLRHGEAVALGMRCAARLSVELGLLSVADEARHNALLDRLNLPRRFPGTLDPERAWSIMGRDKKTAAGRRVFILARRLGEALVYDEASEAAMASALRAVAGDGP